VLALRERRVDDFDLEGALRLVRVLALAAAAAHGEHGEDYDQSAHGRA
jgi:hypothetical protein